MSFAGIAETAVLEAVAIFGVTPRSIGGIVLNVTVEETGVDEMEITQHPVEQSAAISDHAFKKPATVTIKGGSSNSTIAAALDPNYVIDIYNKLLALQASANVFTVITGKRSYSNMLMLSLTQQTDKRYENSLMVTCVFQQIIIVQTSVTPIAPAASQADPASNSDTTNTGTQMLGPAPNFNAAAVPSGGA